MSASTPFVRRAGRPSASGGASLFAPLLLFLTALGLLLWTLPLTGVSLPHIPGTRTALALVHRVPLPWHHAPPSYVPLPEAADVASAGAAVPAADTAAARTVASAPQDAQASQAASATSNTIAIPIAPATTDAPAATTFPASPAASTAAAPEAAAPAVAVPVAPAPPAPAVTLPAQVKLDHFTHQWQTWNNCGPATITMALSHFGRTETQVQAAPFLKPNPNDKNVSPDELVAYVRSIGMRSDWLVAGTLDRLKALLANDIPVVVETWYTPHPNDGMGHYRLLVGYDDAAQQFIAYDSYEAPGLNVSMPYARFDDEWRVFNRTYLPVYPADRASVVDGIIGADRDETQMRQRALEAAQSEAAAKPNDAYAWFDVGTNLVALGRTSEAVTAYDKARTLKLPWRMLWYQFGPFEAYLAEGRLNDVLALANANLQQASDLEESQYYRGRALQAQGQIAQAKAAYQAAVRANPKYAPALYYLSQIGA